MNTYSFSDEALQDLDQLCEYIAQRIKGRPAKSLT